MACVWTAEPTTIYGEILKFVGWGLTTLGGAFIGSFLGSYMKKKGENVATHEDIGKLVDQMKAVTQATKEIESRISGEAWDRQKRWELKRQVLFDTLRRVAAVDDLLGDLDNILQTETDKPEVKNITWTQTLIDANTKWFDALAALEESQLLVETTCAKEVVDSISDYRGVMIPVGAKINKKDVDVYRSSRSDRTRLRSALRNAVRKELGIDRRD